MPGYYAPSALEASVEGGPSIARSSAQFGGEITQLRGCAAGPSLGNLPPRSSGSARKAAELEETP